MPLLSSRPLSFHLDVVLSAFATGFVLRRALPEGDESLEHKLEGLAFGLLIPIFFITSGMAIDPAAIAADPLGLVIFVLAILVIRGGPILCVESHRARPCTHKHVFSGLQSAQIALYGATGLPIIVAVTAVAVKSEHMSSSNASLLVAGGRDYRSAPADDRCADRASAQPASRRRQRYHGSLTLQVRAVGYTWCGLAQHTIRINTGASRDNALTVALHRRTFETGEARLKLALVFRSPPCVCGCDVIEVTHDLSAATSKGLVRLSEYGGQLLHGAVKGGDRRARGSAETAVADRSGAGPAPSAFPDYAGVCYDARCRQCRRWRC